jgi:Ca2+-binding EF-hand superfamily protein
VISTQTWLTSYPSSEFRNFVERTEKELFSLFHSIDRDHNGKLDKEELKAAFKRAGLTVPNSKLDQFFAEVDENHDVCLLYLRVLTATI